MQRQNGWSFMTTYMSFRSFSLQISILRYRKPEIAWTITVTFLFKRNKSDTYWNHWKTKGAKETGIFRLISTILYKIHVHEFHNTITAFIKLGLLCLLFSLWSVRSDPTINNCTGKAIPPTSASDKNASIITDSRLQIPEMLKEDRLRTTVGCDISGLSISNLRFLGRVSVVTQKRTIYKNASGRFKTSNKTISLTLKGLFR